MFEVRERALIIKYIFVVINLPCMKFNNVIKSSKIMCRTILIT